MEEKNLTVVKIDGYEVEIFINEAGILQLDVYSEDVEHTSRDIWITRDLDVTSC